jgi:hypothetical protein
MSAARSNLEGAAAQEIESFKVSFQTPSFINTANKLQHQPGLKVNNGPPTTHLSTHAPGTAPAGSSYRPNTSSEANPSLDDNATHINAQDTLGGASSLDVKQAPESQCMAKEVGRSILMVDSRERRIIVGWKGKELLG